MLRAARFYTVGRTTNCLKKAQMDLKATYDHYALFQRVCQRRNVKFPLEPDFQAKYEQIAVLDASSMENRQQANQLQKKLGELKKSKAEEAQIKVVLDQLSALKPVIKANNDLKQQIQDDLYTQAANLPNYIHKDVQSEQVLVEYLNPTEALLDPAAPKDYPLKPNEKRDHKDIMERFGIVNFSKATTNSGRGWYYLLGGAAMLEQALVQYALSLARKSGFTMATPPSIVKTEITNACGFKPRDQNNETQVYELPDNLCLTGTAEIPLASLYSDYEFKAKKLPLNLVGVSRSYRAEAGAAGRDTRGLYRVHEFTKVELFCWTKPEQSEETFDKLVEFQKKFVSSLGLTARVLIMPSDDLGNPAYKKIDIEVLMPGRGAWGEVTSTSNCLDFQSRRLTTKYREHDKARFVHTLNGTACAVPRVILAIVENFYDPTRDVIVIPEVLRPFMDDMEYISK